METKTENGNGKHPISASEEAKITVVRDFDFCDGKGEVIRVRINDFDVFTLHKFNGGDIHVNMTLGYKTGTGRFHSAVTRYSISVREWMSKSSLIKRILPRWKKSQGVWQDFDIDAEGLH